MKVMLEEVALAFPEIFAPKAIGDGDPSYSARFPIEPRGDNAEILEKAIREVAREKWGEKADQVLEGLYEDDKVCLQKKEYKNKKTREVYDGFQGVWNVGVRRAQDKPRPTTFDENGDEVGPSSGKIYPGAIVDARIEIWAQDNTWGRRINADFLGVKFVRHGKAFGGGSAPAQADDFKKRDSGKAGDEFV